MLDGADIHPLFAGAPDTTEFRKLRKRIVRLTREAVETYAMCRPGERWLVCLSGGKDSYTLLAALVEYPSWSRPNGLPVAFFAHQGVGEDDELTHDRG